MTATVQREHWKGQPTYLGDLFRARKARADEILGAVCKLWTHGLGRELRLEIKDDLKRSEVFRSQDGVLTAGEAWKRRAREEVAVSERFLPDSTTTRSRRGCRIIAANWGCRVQVRHRMFEATFKSWETLCEEAAAFATTVGKDRLINISVSQADTGGKGVIFVWYWE